MTLNNIFREPRRELTETGIGLVLTVGAGGSILGTSYYLTILSEQKDFWFHWIIITLGLVIALMLTAAVVAISHSIGESLCDKLQKQGLNLRPKQRYR